MIEADLFKDIIPIQSTILTDPFVLSNSTLLLATLKVTQSTILNCWPRMLEAVHRLELVKALSLCWLTVERELDQHETASTDMIAIKQELINTGGLLIESVQGDMIVTDELKSLTSIEPSLTEMFDIKGLGLHGGKEIPI